MGDAAFLVVRPRAAEFLLGDFLVGDGLDDVGASDEHVRSLARHENEIGDGGGVEGAASAWAHHGADLRDDSAAKRVAEENIGVTRERGDTFLNARAAGIVEADDGSARAHGKVHDFADFLRVGFRERTAENGKVLRENINQAAIDTAEAGDETIAGGTLLLHAEIDATVTDKFVEFFEGAFVQQKMDALAGGKFAGFVFALPALRAATGLRFLGNAAKLFHTVSTSGFGNQTGLGLSQRVLPRKGIPSG